MKKKRRMGQKVGKYEKKGQGIKSGTNNEKRYIE